jgi:hypothetical protein
MGIENKVQYESSFTDGTEIKRHINNYKKCLKGIDVLLSRGSSGCCIASGIIATSKIKINHVHIRKDRSHSGVFCGGSHINTSLKYAIVDDFIANGETIKTIIVECKRVNITIDRIVVSHLYGNYIRNDIKKMIKDYNLTIYLVYNKLILTKDNINSFKEGEILC